MASAFTICGLAENWREPTPIDGEGSTGYSIPNPPWLVALTAVSLAIALFMTLILALDMANLLTTAIAKPVIILGWYISSFLLIALVSVISSSSQLRHPPQTAGVALSQSFYYAALAAGLHFVAASLMLVSVYGAYSGHHKPEFRAAMSQKALMLKVVVFATYLLGGGAVFARVEGWSFLDAVYWADVSILTVGIGDFAPQTHLGRSLLFPYAVGGVISLGLVVGSIQSFVKDRKKKRLHIMIDKKRRNLLKHSIAWYNKARPLLLPKSQDRNVDQRCQQVLNEEGFNTMRTVQTRAASELIWNTFLGSVIAWFMLWLFSAAVFKQAEREQGWSYFESIYFTYTSLMTIGYGDFAPKSNFGKPFFVFWSLLAVPILTLLIGAMDGTLMKDAKVLIVWNWKFSSHERRFNSKLERVRRKIFNGQRSDGGNQTDSHPESIIERRMNGYKGKTAHPPLSEDIPNDYGEGTRTRMAKAAETDRSLYNDPTRYHYVLIEEIQNVACDLSSSPRKKHYTYDEWMRFLALSTKGNEPSAFHVGFPEAGRSIVERRQEEASSSAEVDEAELTSQWGWFGDQTPFVSEKTETAWVLEQLMAALSRGLKQELDERSKETSGKF